jgi:hypothetical protein
LQVSLLTADDLYGQVPPLEKDIYFGEPPPDYLPYTKSSVKDISQPFMGSTADVRYYELDVVAFECYISDRLELDHTVTCASS